jgi:hypothetical protein
MADDRFNVVRLGVFTFVRAVESSGRNTRMVGEQVSPAGSPWRILTREYPQAGEAA